MNPAVLVVLLIAVLGALTVFEFRTSPRWHILCPAEPRIGSESRGVRDVAELAYLLRILPQLILAEFVFVITALCGAITLQCLNLIDEPGR